MNDFVGFLVALLTISFLAYGEKTINVVQEIVRRTLKSLYSLRPSGGSMSRKFYSQSWALSMAVALFIVVIARNNGIELAVTGWESFFPMVIVGLLAGTLGGGVGTILELLRGE